MFKKILIVLIFLIAAFAGVVAMQPEAFRVTRSATIAAPAADIFAHINDLHKWEAWSPWAKLDPNARTTIEGSKEGTGAVMHWAGNSDVGEGSMTITESKPAESIRFRLDFVKPMESTSTAEFSFKAEGDKTNVTWTMEGKNNFVGKAIGLIFDCEKMVGDQFEQGLSNLKTLVEGRTAKQ